jgi:hypothetical protein
MLLEKKTQCSAWAGRIRYLLPRAEFTMKPIRRRLAMLEHCEAKVLLSVVPPLQIPAVEISATQLRMDAPIASLAPAVSYDAVVKSGDSGPVKPLAVFERSDLGSIEPLAIAQNGDPGPPRPLVVAPGGDPATGPVVAQPILAVLPTPGLLAIHDGDPGLTAASEDCARPADVITVFLNQVDRQHGGTYTVKYSAHDGDTVPCSTEVIFTREGQHRDCWVPDASSEFSTGGPADVITGFLNQVDEQHGGTYSTTYYAHIGDPAPCATVVTFNQDGEHLNCWMPAGVASNQAEDFPAEVGVSFITDAGSTLARSSK